MARRTAAPSRAPALGVVCFAVLLIGIGLIMLGEGKGTTALDPPRPSSNATTSRSSAAPSAVTPLHASRPVRLRIPSLDLSTPVVTLGLAPDGTVQVPPIEARAPVGWYRGSPTPGEPGASVIVGHSTVGSYGKGVFFRLGTLTPGREIDVSRADHTMARFTVRTVREYPKSDFPTQEVYRGGSAADLRLITCAGPRDSHHQYLDNIVVYATLSSSR
ncbi:class F sortase [Streptomyces sp. cg36]|uniref:class F sortase n=1 Tax=Streptomyces sp. cg36 TaxID=3238798 RepID=UPI0034E19F1C